MSRRDDRARQDFTEMVRTHYAELFDFAFSYLRASQDAEDVVQDVLLAVWERREVLQTHSSIKAYLFRAVRNRSLNALRNAKETVDLTQEDFREPDHQLEDLRFQQLTRDVLKAVSELPERQREAFRLSRLYGLTYKEIASVMGVSVNTVRSQISSALEHMRTRLANHL